MGGAFGQHHRIIGGPLMGIGSPRHRAGQWRSRCALERESEDKSLGGSLGKVFYGGGSRFSVQSSKYGHWALNLKAVQVRSVSSI